MCYARGREEQGLCGFVWSCPHTTPGRRSPTERAHPTLTSIADGSWGSQCPSVDVLLHITAQHFAPLGHAEWKSLVKRYSYRERDYAFAQMMLTLRTSIGLTQAGLADRLGVSRRAVAEWEAGSSYPKAERLKQLIELGVQLQVFPAGREAEEIRALWRAAHQKLLLDEAWLHDLVAPPVPLQLFPQVEPTVAPAFEETAAFPRVDWVGALDVSHFAGREVEVAELTQWIVQERCRLVSVLGMGGIGKSMLASYLGLRLAPHFAGAAYHADFGPLAGEPLPAGARQPRDPAVKWRPRGGLPAGLRGLRAADRAPGRVGPPELRAGDLPGEAQGDRSAGRHSLTGALAAPGGDGRPDRPRAAQRQGTQRHTCCLAAPRGYLRGQSAGPEDRGAGGLRPLRWRSRPLPAGGGADLQRRPPGAAPAGGAALAPGAPAAHLVSRVARVDAARHPRAGPASPGAALETL